MNRLLQGDLAGALADLTEAIQRNPRHAAAFNNRANAHMGLHDLENAAADVEEALRIDPRFSSAYGTRAAVRRAQGNLEGSLADLNELIQLTPQQAQAWHDRGLVHLALHNRKQAVADFDEAIRLDPLHGQAHLFRGNTRFHLGDVQGALDDYTRADEINPTQSARLTARILVSLARENSEGIFKDCARHLNENPNDCIAYGWRGWTLLYLGREEEAQRDLAERIRTRPEDRGLVERITAEVIRLRERDKARQAQT
jgi:tetratricopeptide (TPR) repeat protein